MIIICEFCSSKPHSFPIIPDISLLSHHDQNYGTLTSHIKLLGFVTEVLFVPQNLTTVVPCPTVPAMAQKNYSKMVDLSEVHNELSLEHRRVNILPEPLPGQKNDGSTKVEVSSCHDVSSEKIPASKREAFFASPLRASVVTGVAVFVFCAGTLSTHSAHILSHPFPFSI